MTSTHVYVAVAGTAAIIASWPLARHAQRVEHGPPGAWSRAAFWSPIVGVVLVIAAMGAAQL